MERFCSYAAHLDELAEAWPPRALAAEKEHGVDSHEAKEMWRRHEQASEGRSRCAKFAVRCWLVDDEECPFNR